MPNRTQTYKFIKPLLQIDELIRSSDHLGSVSLNCPHCRKIGMFGAVAPAAFRKTLVGGTVTDFTAAIRVCPNKECRGLIFVVDQNGSIHEALPKPTLDFDPTGLPPRCQITLEEAIKCHSAGAYRAAAMMVRRLLEEICEENGAVGDNLHKRLAALKSKITLPTALFDAMAELKALGNDAAHIEAKDYDNIGMDEAEDSIELAKEILKALYQLQALLGRLQARKTGVSAS